MAIVEFPRVMSVHGWPTGGITAGRVRSELRRGQWRRLARGYVLTRPEEPDRADWAIVGLCVAGSGAALSGWDALRLYGIGDRRAPSGPVLVLAPRGGNRMIGPVRVRGTTRPFVSRVTSPLEARLPGIRVVNVPRAVSDLALSGAPTTQIRAAATAAVQRRLCTPAEFATELRVAASHRRSALRRAVGDLLDGARSIAEARAADRLRRAPVPPFELNVSIVDGPGRVIAVVDVLWRELRAALEIDSREFHYDEASWQRTLRRHNRLTRCGIAVTHYSPAVVDEPGWTAEIVAWLRGRAGELGLPYRPGGGVRRGGPPLNLAAGGFVS